jgi:hypothetical protein
MIMPATEAARLSERDYVDIHELYAKYCFAVDLGDGELRAATFVPDGTFTAAASENKPETVAAMAERTWTQGNTGRRHLITNIVVTATAEGAAGRAYCLILQPPKPEAVGLVGHVGIYEDALVRTDDGWRFKTRIFWRDRDPQSPFVVGAPPAPLPWRT